MTQILEIALLVDSSGLAGFRRSLLTLVNIAPPPLLYSRFQPNLD
jgi:hypothetical protein